LGLAGFAEAGAATGDDTIERRSRQDVSRRLRREMTPADKPGPPTPEAIDDVGETVCVDE